MIVQFVCVYCGERGMFSLQIVVFKVWHKPKGVSQTPGDTAF